MRVITLPQRANGEISILKALLEGPDVLVHIRKPTLSRVELSRYMAQFSAFERRRMVLHQHLELVADLGMLHIHHSTSIRQRLLAQDSSTTSLTSTSTHSWEEFNELPSFYRSAFVSPVFPSISKQNYGKDQQVSLTGRKNTHSLAVALGGISSQSIHRLGGSDFQDFALCGTIWEAHSPLDETKKCQEIFQSLSFQNPNHVF